MRSWPGLTFALLLLVGCAPKRPPSERVRVTLSTELSTLDPHVSDTTGAYMVLGNVYETLVAVDPGLGLRPALAARWYNPDPLTWTFELEPRARFHSGRVFSSADVVYSIRRVIEDSNLDARYYLGDIASVEATGRLAVRITLKRRSPVLLSKLGHLFIVPDGSTAARLDRTSDGTGPYRVSSWLPGRKLEMERVESPRRPLPPITRAEIRVNVPPPDAVRAIAGGEADMAQVGLAGLASELSAERFVRHQRASLRLKYLGFDLRATSSPFVEHGNPFRDRRVGVALPVALYRAALVAALPTPASVANQLVPRHVFGFDADLVQPEPDAVRARHLLRDAGLPGGFTVTMHTREILLEGAEIVQRQLRAAGIEVRLMSLPDAEYFRRFKQREPVFWLDRFACTTGDSGELFENVFHSSDPARGMGEFNETGYSNPGLDRAIESAVAVEDLSKRRVALSDLMRRVMDELLWVPLYTDDEVWAVGRTFVWTPRSDYWLQLADVAPASQH
jgi:peptide/nickel transport system substrate-binding protein